MTPLGDESSPGDGAGPVEPQPNALARRLLLGGRPAVLESEIDESLQILSLHQMADVEEKQIIKPVTYRKRTLLVDDVHHHVLSRTIVRKWKPLSCSGNGSRIRTSRCRRGR